MKTTWKPGWRSLAALALLAAILGSACSNSHVSTGLNIHRNSSGNWGHSISVGIHGFR